MPVARRWISSCREIAVRGTAAGELSRYNGYTIECHSNTSVEDLAWLGLIKKADVCTKGITAGRAEGDILGQSCHTVESDWPMLISVVKVSIEIAERKEDEQE